MEGKALLRTTQSCHASLGAGGAPGQGQSRGTAGETLAFGHGLGWVWAGLVTAAEGWQDGLLSPGGCERVPEHQVAVLPRGHSAPAEGWGAGSVLSAPTPPPPLL